MNSSNNKMLLIGDLMKLPTSICDIIYNEVSKTRIESKKELNIDFIEYWTNRDEYIDRNEICLNNQSDRAYKHIERIGDELKRTRQHRYQDIGEIIRTRRMNKLNQLKKEYVWFFWILFKSVEKETIAEIISVMMDIGGDNPLSDHSLKVRYEFMNYMNDNTIYNHNYAINSYVCSSSLYTPLMVFTLPIAECVKETKYAGKIDNLNSFEFHLWTGYCDNGCEIKEFVENELQDTTGYESFSDSDDDDSSDEWQQDAPDEWAVLNAKRSVEFKKLFVDNKKTIKHKQLDWIIELQLIHKSSNELYISRRQHGMRWRVTTLSSLILTDTKLLKKKYRFRNQSTASKGIKDDASIESYRLNTQHLRVIEYKYKVHTELTGKASSITEFNLPNMRKISVINKKSLENEIIDSVSLYPTTFFTDTDAYI